MTDNTWQRPSSGQTWLAPLPDELRSLADPPLLALLDNQSPRQLPSGIPGLRLNEDDHIAVLVMTDGDEYYRLLLNFLAAGVDNPFRQEHLTLELTEGRDDGRATSDLQQIIRRPLPATVDVVSWERNRSDYEPESFDRPGMWRAIDEQAARLSPYPNAVLRVASEDCSNFMKWLRNPTDYLAYEYELQGDLRRRLGGRKFLQLCAFKSSNLRLIARRNGIPVKLALLDLALSHNRLVVVDGNRVLVGRAALAYVLRETLPMLSPRIVWRWLRLGMKWLATIMD